MLACFVILDLILVGCHPAGLLTGSSQGYQIGPLTGDLDDFNVFRSYQIPSCRTKKRKLFNLLRCHALLSQFQILLAFENNDRTPALRPNRKVAPREGRESATLAASHPFRRFSYLSMFWIVSPNGAEDPQLQQALKLRVVPPPPQDGFVPSIDV